MCINIEEFSQKRGGSQFTEKTQKNRGEKKIEKRRAEFDSKKSLSEEKKKRGQICFEKERIRNTEKSFPSSVYFILFFSAIFVY